MIACDKRGVRLGIEAPSDVGIVREEIATLVADENRRASAFPDASGLLRMLEPAGRVTPAPRDDTAA